MRRMHRALAALTGALAVAMLAACATPHVHAPGAAQTRAQLNHVDAVMDDGYRLPLSRWLPTGECRAVVLALHGLNDYRNAFRSTGDYLVERGITVYAYDQRGFGATEGFGEWHGVGRLVADLEQMVTLLRGRHPHCPLYVMGESMGGAVTLAALGDGLDIDGAILIAPAVWSRDTMPLYQRAALWLAAHTMPARRLSGKGLDITPSDNTDMLRALGRDPLVIKETRVDVLYGVTNLMDLAAATSPATGAPTLLLYGMHDEIIPRKPTCELLRRLPDGAGSPWQIRLYDNGYHMLTRDLQAEVVLRDIAGWLLGDPALRASGSEKVAQFCGS